VSRVLVTGGSGFLGRNLLSKLSHDSEIVAVCHSSDAFEDWLATIGHPRASAVRCDLTVPGALAEALGGAAEFDVVYHCAARVEIPNSVSDPDRDLGANGATALHVVRETRCSHLVALSSGAVYEGHEGPVHPGLHVAPSLPYAAHKLLVESYARAACERWATADRVTVVRFFGAYGPGEAARKIHTRLITELALERRDTFEIYGDGTNLIDAMWVGDAVAGLLAIAASPPGAAGPVRTVDFAAGEPISVETLVRRAAAALGRPDIELRKHGVAHESNRFHADPALLWKELGVRAETPLEEGIAAFERSLRALARPGPRPAA
jgi:nucleoside-diphosphate-sugar epimerase